MDKSAEEIRQIIANVSITPGEIYIHKTSTHRYFVKEISILESTLEPCVVYEGLYEGLMDISWIRTVENFTELVEVDGKKIPRFRKFEFDQIGEKLKSLLDFVKTLGLNPDEYAIWGSTPLYVKGLLAGDPEDIDMIVTQSGWDKLIKREDAKIETLPWDQGTHVVRLLDGAVEAFTKWGPGEWDIAEVINTGFIVDDIKFASLRSVYDWKCVVNRPKDQLAISVLKHYLNLT